MNPMGTNDVLNSNDPQLNDPGWRNGVVHSSSKGMLLANWAFVILWNTLTWVGSVHVIADVLSMEKKTAMVIGGLMLLAVLFGLLIVLFAIKSTREWRHFGATPMKLDPFPGSLGGDVGGWIDVTTPHDPSHRYFVTLTCEYFFSIGTGKKRKTKSKIVWQSQGEAHSEWGPRGTRLRFRFAVPENLSPTGKATNNFYQWKNHHQWQLTLKTDQDGITLNRIFTIPVFRTPSPLRSSAIQTYSTEVRDSVELPSIITGSFIMKQTTAGLFLHSPWWHYIWYRLTGVIFSLFFAAITWYLIEYPTFTDGQDIPKIFVVLFALVAVLTGFYNLFRIGNSLKTFITARELVTIRSIYGFPFIKRIPLQRVTGVQKKVDFLMRGFDKNSLHYFIVIHTNDGTTIPVAEQLNGDLLANQVRQKVMTACGLEQ